MGARIIVHPECIAWYVEQSWDFSYQVFLYRYLLNEEEIALVKEKLHGLYGSLTPESFTDKADEYFKSYCKRIRKLKIKKVRSREAVLSLIYSVIEDDLLSNTDLTALSSLNEKSLQIR